MGHINTVVHFLISLALNLIIFSLWLRIALRYLHVSQLNPFGGLINTVTSPLTQLVRVTLKPAQKYDWPALIIIIILELFKITLFTAIFYHETPPLAYSIFYVISELIVQPCNILFYAILIRTIMSYVNPIWEHPLANILYLLTEPLLQLGRKIIPNISGFDFSPFIIMVLLEIITLLFSTHIPFI